MQRLACFLLIASCLLLVSCTFPGSTSPTFKIGLVAPFEGRYRPVGYDAIYAARLAVRQANADGGVGGYRVELIAYDDGGDPDVAARQAGMLALDPAVIGVIGHFRASTTQVAVPVYADAALPLLVPANVPADELAPALGLGPTSEQLATALQAAVQLAHYSHVMLNMDALSAGELVKDGEGTLAGGPDLALPDFAAIAGADAQGTLFVTGVPWPQDIPGADQFIAEYASVSGGLLPGPYAWTAYQAARVLLEAIQQDIQLRGAPSRIGAARQLDVILADKETPVYVYRYDATGRAVLVK